REDIAGAGPIESAPGQAETARGVSSDSVPIDHHIHPVEEPGIVVGAPGGLEADDVGPGREFHGLADATGCLHEGDLGTLGSIGVTRGKAAAVAADARA